MFILIISYFQLHLLAIYAFCLYKYTHAHMHTHRSFLSYFYLFIQKDIARDSSLIICTKSS